MPNAYLASSLPPHELAELHRLMNEEIEEVAVFFLNTDGIITVWSRGAEDMKGFTAEDAIGSPLSMLYTPEDQGRGWPEHNLDAARKDGFYREETWRRRKDGSLFWARIALTALRDHA
ncbi:MAG: PAS domain S-box protein, partial [Pseudomonadota bacterium]|nr:PAS domain S-box protein [Pseudomonadota bacterium]